jgi:hypothetical protein
LLPSSGCDHRPTSAATAEEAVRVTTLYRTENFPQAKLDGVVVETRDSGDRWSVTYSRPGAIGGVSSYEVDKRSARIVHSEGGQ